MTSRAWRDGAGPFVDLAVVTIAFAGLWLFWSHYAYLSTLSWRHQANERLSKTSDREPPDYELSTLRWQRTTPKVFELDRQTLHMVTGPEPFGYQAYATVPSKGASSVDFHFDAFVESGAVSIGVLVNGKWVASVSSKNPGPFAGSDAARMGFNKTFTVVIANNNEAGESRLTLKSLRLYLRR